MNSDDDEILSRAANQIEQESLDKLDRFAYQTPTYLAYF